VKKFFLIIAFLLPLSLQAQVFSFGTGYTYGFREKLSGVNFRGFLHLTYRLNAGLEYNYFFPADMEGLTRGRSDVMLNARYYFPVKQKWKVYPLAGFGWNMVKSTEPSLNESHTNKASEGGINTGLGLIYGIGRISGFIEFQKTFGRLGQAQIILGISLKQVRK
jgi:opacity protein-like surface antigen